MLGTLAGAFIIPYLIEQKRRENVFEETNDISVKQIANEYKPFNNGKYNNVVGCIGSYPGSQCIDNNNEYPNYINTNDPNYIKYINGIYYGNNSDNMYDISAISGNSDVSVINNYVNPLGMSTINAQNGVSEYDRAMRLNNVQYVMNKMNGNKENFVNMAFNNNYGNDFNNTLITNQNAVRLDTSAIINNNNGDMMAVNDPTNDYLLDMRHRPITDFMHNNMVPAYRGKITQNMQGTGVQQGNYIDGVNIDTGSDNTTPNMTTLGTFTGIDDTYRSKREVGPMYSPGEQQTGWVFGMPLFREDTNIYTRTLTKRNDMKPLETQMVGKGLAIDPSIPAAGGFHEFTRILPNNISDYKSNQLEGRINAGKLVTAGLPEAYPGIGAGPLNGDPNEQNGPGVVKNRPESYWTQNRLPTMTSRAGGVPSASYSEMKSDWNVDKKPNNAVREQTNYGYGSLSNGNQEQIDMSDTQRRLEAFSNMAPSDVTGLCVDMSANIGIGPARGGNMMGPTRSPTYMSMDNNVRSVSDCNSLPLLGPSRGGMMGGNELTNYYVNETGRGEINPQLIEQVGIKGPSQWNNLSFMDQQKTTMRETNEFSYHGNPSKGDQGATYWNYIDGPKTTMRETNEFSYHGNPSKGDQGTTYWNYIDGPKTTMRETNEFSYHGNPGKGDQGHTFQTWDDKLRPTIKQATLFNYEGDPNKANQGHTFQTWDDKMRPTVKQSTLFNYEGDPNKANQGHTFQTWDDKMRPTVKQSTLFNYEGDPNKSNQGHAFYTWDDKPKPTIKQTTEFEYEGIAGPAADNLPTSRALYTGFENENKRESFSNINIKDLLNGQITLDKKHLGGADTYTIKGSTLIENYFYTPGRQNVLLDPNDRIGKFDPGTFGADENLNGPGTLLQSLPDGSRMQNNYIMATPHANPNKLFQVDDRQIASYTVQNLKNNPLSIFTDKPNDDIPKFYQDSKPDDFSPLVPDKVKNDKTTTKRIKEFQNTMAINQSSQNIYPTSNDPTKYNPNALNPNALIVYNDMGITGYNPLIEQGASRSSNNQPEFSGKAYSGKFINNSDKVTIGGINGEAIYGSTYQTQPRQSNSIITEGLPSNVESKPNRALMFTDDLIIDRDLFN